MRGWGGGANGWCDALALVINNFNRLAELETNEQWKAQHCKCCPSCGRCINKVNVDDFYCVI